MLYYLGERIGEMHKTFGITQAGLARRLDVTRSSVNSLEMGLSIPQLKHIVEMSGIFNTTVDGMLNT